LNKAQRKNRAAKKFGGRTSPRWTQGKMQSYTERGLQNNGSTEAAAGFCKLARDFMLQLRLFS
jgi:hypothetical protein